MNDHILSTIVPSGNGLGFDHPKNLNSGDTVGLGIERLVCSRNMLKRMKK